MDAKKGPPPWVCRVLTILPLKRTPTSFCQWRSSVKLDVQAGGGWSLFLSKNRLVEDLLLPVFQIVLNAPRLRNLNQGNVNFPYIDLADDRSRLAVQVTTERSAAKLTETLRQFISHNYHKRFKRLVFFILTASKPRFSMSSKKKWKRICGRKLPFDPEGDIITTLDLFPLIAHLRHSKILSVRDVIDQSVIGEAHIDVEGTF